MPQYGRSKSARNVANPDSGVEKRSGFCHCLPNFGKEGKIQL
jgi:hypothetical protein